MKVTVSWNEVSRYNANIEVPDGLSEEEITNYIHECAYRWRSVGECVDEGVRFEGEINYDSIEWSDMV